MAKSYKEQLDDLLVQKEKLLEKEKMLRTKALEKEKQDKQKKVMLVGNTVNKVLGKDFMNINIDMFKEVIQENKELLIDIKKEIFP